VVDKPPGWTSFDVCGALRGALRVKRVGHAGTLDPLATGVLVVCAGKATKSVPTFTDADKEYEGVLRLGEATPTLDAGSLVTETAPWHHITDAALQAAAAALTGPAIQQVVPMFSAVRIGGQRLYAAARAGKEVERPPRSVRVDVFEVSRLGADYSPTPLEAAAAEREITRSLVRAARLVAEAEALAAGAPLPDARQRKRQRRRRRKAAAAAGEELVVRETQPEPLPPPPPPPAIDMPTPGPHGSRDVAFRVACAKGTYIRTLAADLGVALGSTAHVVSLRRTRVGGCDVREAWPVEELVAAARAGVAAESGGDGQQEGG
jgi:tRNA pseudouridine55 synthase